MTTSVVFMPKVVMITGGAGFVGSNLVRWLLDSVPGIFVVNYDLLTYAGSRLNLTDVESRFGGEGNGRYFFVNGDIRDTAMVAATLSGRGYDALGGRPIPRVDAVLHLAAESHVDRSITGPATFVSTNVEGTLSLLTAMRAELDSRPREFRFINVSTDEVYGSLGDDDLPFTELHPLRPNSPYSASKAGADCLVRAFVQTYGLPCITTRSSNNYGPYQFPEKLIPFMITRALKDQSLPVYGDGAHVRDWLHVWDHAAALWRVLTEGQVTDEVFNIGGQTERQNIDVVRGILAELGKPESLIEYVADRPGHDRRYATDIGRISTWLEWTPTISFEAGLPEMVAWYKAHMRWCERVLADAHHPPVHATVAR